MLPSEFKVYRNDMLEITFILLYATYLIASYTLYRSLPLRSEVSLCILETYDL